MTRLLSRRNRRIALIVLAVLALGVFSPSYSRVIVRRDGENVVDVQRAGFGPQTVHVKTEDASIKASAR